MEFCIPLKNVVFARKRFTFTQKTYSPTKLSERFYFCKYKNSWGNVKLLWQSTKALKYNFFPPISYFLPSPCPIMHSVGHLCTPKSCQNRQKNTDDSSCTQDFVQSNSFSLSLVAVPLKICLATTSSKSCTTALT